MVARLYRKRDNVITTSKKNLAMEYMLQGANQVRRISWMVAFLLFATTGSYAQISKTVANPTLKQPITQPGGGTCVEGVSMDQLSFPFDGGLQQVLIELNPGCSSYMASETCSWITLQKIGAILKVNCIPNTGSLTRQCTITISDGFSILVSQAGMLPPPAQPGPISGPTAGCAGTSASYSVSAVANATRYTWTVTNGTIASGQGNRNVTVTLGTAGTSTLSVVAVNSTETSPSRSTTITVNGPPAKPTAISGPTSTCVGSSANYSISPVSGATSYTWSVTGGTISSGQESTGISAQLTATGGWNVYVSAVNGCGSGPSQTLGVQVNPLPTVYPVAGGGSFCSGGAGVNIVLNNTQSGVSYQAFKNGVQYGSPIAGNGYGINLVTNTTTTGSYTAKGTYTTTGCSASMNGFATVSTYPQPTPTLSASATAICPGSSVTFTASSGSGPTLTSYTFRVNGVVKQAGGSATFITNQLSNGDLVTVDGTSSTGCSATSAGVQITLKPLPTPTLNASATNACLGTVVTFTAGQGSGPAITNYTFRYNGSLWQSGTAFTYSTPALSSGAITVDGTTADGCIATSSPLVLTVNPLPTVYPVAGGGSFCSGGSGVNIVLNNTQSGVNYQAFKDGIQYGSPIAGSGSGVNLVSNTTTTGSYTAKGTYTTTGCSASMSGSATVSTNPQPTPTLSASATTSCAGSPITFTAGSGSGPAIVNYNFRVNGVLKQSGTGTNYTSSTLTNGNVVTVEGTSVGGCTATSAGITITIQPQPTPTLSASATTIYSGTKVIFTAGQGSGPAIVNYAFRVKGVLKQSGAGATYSTSTLAAGDVVTVDGTTVGGCTATSSAITMTVKTSPFATFTPDYDKNFIAAYTPDQPLTDVSTMTKGQLDVSYFDGLGRLSQTIGVGASPVGGDVVTTVQYDQFGRKSHTYLPMVANFNNGAYVDNAVAKVTTFYAGGEQLNGVPTTSVPYVETIYENSMLNRKLEDNLPGEDFAIVRDGTGQSTFTGHTNKYRTEINKPNDVLRFAVSGTTLGYQSQEQNSLPIFGTAPQYYPEGYLAVSMVTDANGATHREYKTSEGIKVLDRAYGDSEVLETYYVYDDLGQLRYVLSPKAVKAIATSGITSDILNELAYSYTYDGRGRLVEKKLPGAEPLYMVYNEQDQLVLMQDGNMRQDANPYWLYSKYDYLGRSIGQGKYYTTQSQAVLQQQVSGLTASQLYESKQANGTYTNQAFPNQSVEPLSYNYYDDYNVTGIAVHAPVAMAGITLPEVFSQGNGLATVHQYKVLGEDTWLYDVTFYDYKYRPVQVYRTNYLGGTDITTTTFDFSGKPLRLLHQHAVPSKPLVYEDIVNTYDRSGRLLNQQVEYRGGVVKAPTNLASYSYNELGRLDSKTLKDGVQEVNYQYNLQGWLTAINNPDNLGSDKFGLRLFYSEAEALNFGADRQQYSGNVAAEEWCNSAGTTGAQAYGFRYDSFNRLVGASYRTKQGASWVAPANGYDLAGVTYDANGNILSLERNSAEVGVLDKLTYGYYNGGNRLQKVDDDGSKTEGFVDGANLPSEYGYDANGSMVTDANQSITVTYNLLDLPDRYVVKGETYSYVYTADGEKVAEKGTGLTTVYDGNFIYENGVLAKVLNSEGYLYVADNPTPTYMLQLTDQLGNVRSVVDENGTVALAASYYPFGGRFGGYYGVSPQGNYLFNGKELQRWGEVYDFGARMYDPTLGRWNVSDPLAEKTIALSPYHFGGNSPIRFIDKYGLYDDDLLPQDGYYSSLTIYGLPGGGSVTFTSSYSPYYVRAGGLYGAEWRWTAWRLGGWNLIDSESSSEEPGGDNLFDVTKYDFGVTAAAVAVAPAINDAYYRDATFIPPTRRGVPTQTDSKSNSGKLGFSDALEVAGKVYPNRLTGKISWAITLYNVTGAYKKGDYNEVINLVIDAAGGGYTVAIKGLNELMQTEYMQMGVGRIYCEEYKNYSYRYYLSNDPADERQAKHYEQLIWETYYNLIRPK